MSTFGTTRRGGEGYTGYTVKSHVHNILEKLALSTRPKKTPSLRKKIRMIGFTYL